jgi:aminoglycoside phosphotransferase (APT) family kinase protein
MPPVEGTPPAELRIDDALVRSLLREQHPDLSALTLVARDSGFDNAIFRLGDSMAVRMPRRAIAAPLLEREQDWLPRIAASLPIPVPAPIRAGVPAGEYPWRWSVVPWLGGDAADLAPPGAGEAVRLAGFLRALHRPAPRDAPRNPVRGVPLAGRATVFEQRVARLAERDLPVTSAVIRAWHAALAAPIDVEDTWIHGDLHARNILAEGGRITGVIDWGDMAAGDRATDLATFWMLFDPPAREEAQRALDDVSAATWARAKGWAALFGVLLLDTGIVDHPRHAAMGRLILSRLANSRSRVESR